MENSFLEAGNECKEAGWVLQPDNISLSHNPLHAREWVLFLYSTAKPCCHVLYPGAAGRSLTPALAFLTSPLAWLQQPPGLVQKEFVAGMLDVSTGNMLGLERPGLRLTCETWPHKKYLVNNILFFNTWSLHCQFLLNSGWMWQYARKCLLGSRDYFLSPSTIWHYSGNSEWINIAYHSVSHSSIG